MERIVAAVDGSVPSLKAVDLAAGLAGKYDAELILVTVAREFSPSSMRNSKPMPVWSTSTRWGARSALRRPRPCSPERG